MDNRQYAQIQYDPNDVENAEVTEVIEDREISEEKSEEEISEILAKEVKSIVQNDESEEKEPDLDTKQTENQETLSDKEQSETDFKEELQTESLEDQTKPHVQADMGSESYAENPAEPLEDQDIHDTEPSDTYKSIEEIKDDIEGICGAIRRLEKKFETEILNAQTKDSMVKAMYQELNEYKAGLVEKAMKNVLYDVIDIREMMFAKARHVRQKEGADVISLEEFESYAEDIGDILEKYDVTIYKGEPGVENTAVRQKIVRKVETEDASLVKKVSESLSFGYEYNGKILYPEKIGIFVKKKTEQD